MKISIKCGSKIKTLSEMEDLKKQAKKYTSHALLSEASIGGTPPK